MKSNLTVFVCIMIFSEFVLATPEACPKGSILYHNGDAVGCFYTPGGVDGLGMSIDEICPVSEKGYTLKRSSRWVKPHRIARKGIGCLVCIHTLTEDLPGTDTGTAAAALLGGDYSGFEPSLNCLSHPQLSHSQIEKPITVVPTNIPEPYMGSRMCLQTYDGNHFVSVNESNNQIVRAEATTCGPFEQINIWFYDTSDPNNPYWKDGYPVPANALVRIQNATGAFLVRNKVGGLQGNNPTGEPERTHFFVERVAIGPGVTAMPGYLKAGDVITLKNKLSGQYVVAEQGGGSEVNSNRDEAVTWERFKLVEPTP